jgi:D-tyrosyl-tRNA(Tyr) deacylase
MKALIQRVSEARVVVDDLTVGAIEHGLLVLVGIDLHDDDVAVEKMAYRLLHYRVFPDDSGRMNLNVCQAAGSLLLVPQFTLAADTRKGLRPSFTSAASPEHGLRMFTALVEAVKKQYEPIETGQFGANMQVSLTNDGPVTFLLES